MSQKRFHRRPTRPSTRGLSSDERLALLESHVSALHTLIQFTLDVVKVRVPRAALPGSRIVTSMSQPTHDDLTLRELYVRLHPPPPGLRPPDTPDTQGAQEDTGTEDDPDPLARVSPVRH